MKINNIDNNSNKTSFGWIIPLNNAEKKCGLETWRFNSRMNGLGAYDVYIKPLKTKTTRERDMGCIGPIIYGGLAILGGMGGIYGSGELISNMMLNLPVDSFLRPIIGITSAIVCGIGAISSVMFKKANDFSVQAATHRGAERDKDNNPTPAGIITKEYTVKNDSHRFNPNINFVNEIIKLKQEKFNNFIKHYDVNDLFEPKNYARVLENRPEGLGNDFFNYKIDDKGNTLLTAFFDVVPDDKIYPKIIEYLQCQQNLDFSQKDGYGISCIEKVLISENKDALNLILNSKYTPEYKKTFGWIIDTPYDEVERMENEPLHNPSVIPYSPELDDIYSNIQDKSFKKMVDDNIKWDFSNWISVIKSHDVSKAEKLKKRFNSPLLNKQQLYDDINKALSSCKDVNFITYMQTNFLKELIKTSTPLQGGG